MKLTMVCSTHTRPSLALLACISLAACSSSSNGKDGSGGGGVDGGATLDVGSGPGGEVGASGGPSLDASSGPGGEVGASGGPSLDASSGLGGEVGGGQSSGTGGSSGSSQDGGGVDASGGSGDTGVFDSSGGRVDVSGEVGGAAGSGGSSRAPAAPAWVPSGASVTWGDYAFTTPPSMQVIADGSQGYYAIGRTGCAITFFPAVASETNADAQAASLLAKAFSDSTKWSGILGIDNKDPLLGTYHRRTITAQGLSAVDLSTGMKDAQGKITSELGRILLVDLGTGESALMIGYQADSGRQCLDEVLNPFEWVLVYYSLSFPQARPANPQAIRDTLIGGWFSSDSGSIISTGMSQVFAANGNYSYAVAVDQYSQIDPNLIQETTSSWSGDGAWRIEHGLLEILPRDPTAPANTNLMRIFWEYNTTTPKGWRWYLHTLDSCGATPCEGWAYHE
jgi:hypothetical protein